MCEQHGAFSRARGGSRARRALTAVSARAATASSCGRRAQAAGRGPKNSKSARLKPVRARGSRGCAMPGSSRAKSASADRPPNRCPRVGARGASPHRRGRFKQRSSRYSGPTGCARTRSGAALTCSMSPPAKDSSLAACLRSRVDQRCVITRLEVRRPGRGGGRLFWHDQVLHDARSEPVNAFLPRGVRFMTPFPKIP